MILILSDRYDQSTNDVIDWLISNKAKFKKINQDDVLKLVRLALEDSKVQIILEFNNEIINLDEIKSYWYRRGGLNLSYEVDLSTLEEDLRSKVRKHLFGEAKVLRDFIYKALENKKSIGSPLTDDINKLDCLARAERLGLKVPKTFIFSSGSDIKSQLKDGEFVTKGIKGVACFNMGIEYIGNYTEQVSSEDVDNGALFFPSLFQEKLDKEYEVRVFYIDGEFYSMCIFSQLDKQTATDFRKYNFKRPNRFVPYKLPAEIENKLSKLLNSFALKTASIDLVFTKNNEYYFLEINPIGQFGMVSSTCNYPLERKIAQYLRSNGGK